MPRPLIEPEDKQPDERLTISLRPDTAQDLRAYAEYAGNSSLSHIVSESLKRLFREDKGFREFKAANPDAGRAAATNGKPQAKAESKRTAAAVS